MVSDRDREVRHATVNQKSMFNWNQSLKNSLVSKCERENSFTLYKVSYFKLNFISSVMIF